MNRNYFAYAIIAILIAFSIGMLAISLGVHFSSAPVEAATLCALGSFCGRAGLVSGSDSLEHLATCAAGHRYWSCTEGFRVQHVNCRAPAPTPAPAPAPTPAPAPAPAPTPASRAQTPSQTPSQPVQTPPASPQQQSCTAPKLTFRKLSIGQSSGTIATTFITTTETTCEVEAEVTYDGSQDPNTCEITSGAWTVTMSHGFTVDTSTVDTDSPGEGFSKVWKYKATLRGNRHKEENECNPNLEPPDPGSKTDYPGRDATRMFLTIRFTGTYSGGTVGRSLAVTQDRKDGIRQEYVDHNRKVVPSRGQITATDVGKVYNWGHYSLMIDLGLDSMPAAWASWCVGLTKTDLVVKSGYRHPHHNVYCIVGPDDPPTSKHGLHQYGCALDLGGKIVYNKDRTVNLSKTSLPDANGDGNITPADRTALKDAALKAGSHTYRRIYPTGHVHADWRPTNWIPPAGSSLGSPRPTKTKTAGGGSGGGSGDSGGGSDTAPAAPAAPTTPSVSPPPTTTPTTPTTVRCGNRWRGPGRCSSGGRASSRTAHESTCGAGHTYWSCNRTAVAWHATSHTCTRSGCGQTYTNCSKGNGTCSGGRYTWHD